MSMYKTRNKCQILGPLLYKKIFSYLKIFKFWGAPGTTITMVPGKKGYAQFFRACFLM